ncbi:MAG: hypothetical protein JSW64_07845 [Candidatus Zixiibacteriota bacterium]|nr:MAG: hypothetical protein JSW64_07845 [candidate division Zixibacteria bacterium]
MKAATKMNKSNLTFKFVKALINASDSDSELSGFLTIVENSTKRNKLINILKNIIDLRSNTLNLPKIEPKEKIESKRQYSLKYEIAQLSKRFKNGGLTAPIIHDIILRRYNENIPVNKEGLEKYLNRLSKKNYFDSLISFIKFKYLRSSIKPMEDPWFREMIKEKNKKTSG